MGSSLNVLILSVAVVVLAAGSPLAMNPAVDKLPSDARQLIVVVTPDWNTVDGRLVRFERTTPGAEWRRVGDAIPIVVGKTGLAWGLGVVSNKSIGIGTADPIKREGDGRAPAGVFSLGTAFGVAPRALPGSKTPYVRLTPTVECVDDTKSKYYNRIVDRASVVPDWDSSEKMLSVGDPYRWGLFVDHNVSADGTSKPGSGSCIFLHIWRGPGHGTVGCTAMDQSELERLLAWVDPARKPLLVQLPAGEYERLQKSWGLPVLPRTGSR